MIVNTSRFGMWDETAGLREIAQINGDGVSSMRESTRWGLRASGLEKRLGPFLKEGEPWVRALHYRL